MINIKLKELREEKGLRQKDLATALNISITGYASWEQGKAEPNIEQIKKIVSFYEISLNEIFEHDENFKERKKKLTDKVSQKYGDNEEFKNLIAELNELTPDKKQILLDSFHAFIKNIKKL